MFWKKVVIPLANNLYIKYELRRLQLRNMKPINVIILEGKPSTMLGIKSIVENQSDIQLIAYCSNEKDFTDTIRDINMDIAIVDVNLVRDILNLAPESRADYAYSISRDSNSSAQSITYTNQDNSKLHNQTNLELSLYCIHLLTNNKKLSRSIR